MQTFDLNGLKVKCENEKEHEQYVELKDSLERIRHDVRALAIGTGHKGITSHAIKLNGTMYLSVCVKDDDIQFGVYDSAENKIRQENNFADLKSLSAGDLAVFKDRACAVASHDFIPHLNKLTDVWTQEMASRSEKQIDNDLVFSPLEKRLKMVTDKYKEQKTASLENARTDNFTLQTQTAR